MSDGPGEDGNPDTAGARDAAPFAGNDLSGVVIGPSLQARDIHGDLYFHQPPSRMPRPSQLPPAPRLSGRAAELELLAAARADRAVVVSGPAGVGKTALAVRWAHSIRADFSDGALYADLHGHAPDGPAAPSEILGRFLRALGIEPQHLPAELAEQTALYRSATADRHLIVVLDDALSAAQVIPLLPASSACMTVITSRWRLTSLRTYGARIIQLGRLMPDAALELLAETLGDDRAQREPDAGRELVDLCGRLPLAVCVAAARLAARPRWTVREMVDALTHERQRLAALTMEGDPAVRASLDLSYRALPPAEARMYRLMGLYPGTVFDSRVAAATAGVPGSEARRLLGVLTDGNLLDDAAFGQYRLHELTRLHAREAAERDEPGALRAAAIRRMLDWFLVSVMNAGQLVMPYRRDPPADVEYPPAEQARFSGPDNALDWLDRLLPSVLAAVRFAAAQGLAILAWQLTDAMWPLFLHRGHYAERLEMDRAGLAAARACADAAGEAKMLNRVGLALRDVGQPDEADRHFRQALTIWKRLHNDERVIGSLRRLGTLAADRHQFGEAIGYFSDAVDLSRQIGENRRTALALSDLGGALTGAGRAAEAVAPLREAVGFIAEADDPFNEARITTRLGRAQVHDRQYGPAADNLGAALAVMRERGSLPGQADALEALAELAEHTGQSAEARRQYEAALAILTRLGAGRARRLRVRLQRLNDAEPS
jgi:tetratricopeptide (TPR) repeat protein